MVSFWSREALRLAAILNAINQWALSVIQALGYPGLGLVMFLENVFPPIPSEVVLPLAGWLTLDATSGFSLLGVTVVGALGSLGGAFCFYGLGKWFAERRIRCLLRRLGRWFLLSERDLDIALTWFDRYGEYVVFFGRMVPVVRSLISIPAGLAGMHIGMFMLYTAGGTALWSLVLAFAGRLLGTRWQLVAEFVDRYEAAVFALTALIVTSFVISRWAGRRSQKRLGL